MQFSSASDELHPPQPERSLTHFDLPVSSHSTPDFALFIPRLSILHYSSPRVPAIQQRDTRALACHAVILSAAERRISLWAFPAEKLPGERRRLGLW